MRMLLSHAEEPPMGVVAAAMADAVAAAGLAEAVAVAAMEHVAVVAQQAAGVAGRLLPTELLSMLSWHPQLPVLAWHGS